MGYLSAHAPPSPLNPLQVSVDASYGVLVPGIYAIPDTGELSFHSYGNGAPP